MPNEMNPDRSTSGYTGWAFALASRWRSRVAHRHSALRVPGTRAHDERAQFFAEGTRRVSSSNQFSTT